jgi:hypothetical protein
MNRKLIVGVQKEHESEDITSLKPLYFVPQRNLVFFLYMFFSENLGPVWLHMLKFNKHCSTFVLFDKKFPILD